MNDFIIKWDRTSFSIPVWVCIDEGYNKWMVRININKKRKNLGYYDTFEEAVNVRKKAEQEFYNVH